MKSNVKNSIDSAIGKVFKSYRKKYHLTQTQVADKLGISEKYISRLENGNSGVKLETLINYMNTLGIAPDVLFKDLMRNNDVVFQVNLSQKISELPKERQRFINKIKKSSTNIRQFSNICRTFFISHYIYSFQKAS